MKTPLQELLLDNISDDTIFYIFKFVHGLSKTLESICFDRMLQSSSSCAVERPCAVNFSQPNRYNEDEPF
jgi:hypothetical protein